MLMPLPIHLAHRIVEKLAEVRQKGKLPWLRPDGKSQVTIEYDNERPGRAFTPSSSPRSTMRSVLDKKKDVITEKAKREIIEQVIRPTIPKKLWNDDIIFHINPTGKFVVGGPHGDTGLTGRKIIVDSYGGRGAHGGGAFSGKDPSQGRSQRLLHGPLHRQEHRRRRPGRQRRSAACLRDRRGQAGQRDGQHRRTPR